MTCACPASDCFDYEIHTCNCILKQSPFLLQISLIWKWSAGIQSPLYDFNPQPDQVYLHLIHQEPLPLTMMSSCEGLPSRSSIPLRILHQVHWERTTQHFKKKRTMESISQWSWRSTAVRTQALNLSSKMDSLLSRIHSLPLTPSSTSYFQSLFSLQGCFYFV